MAAYEDQIVCFKTGTYDIYASSTTDYPSINAGVKPISYIGIEVMLFLTWITPTSLQIQTTLLFKNIIWDGCDVTAANCRLLQVSTKGDNYMFDGLTYRNQTTPGTDGGDNPACIFFSDAGTLGSNISVIGCHHESTTDFQLFVTFSSENVLIEGNTADSRLELYTIEQR